MKIVKDKIKVITKEEKWTSWAELKALSEAGKLGEVLKSQDNMKAGGNGGRNEHNRGRIPGTYAEEGRKSSSRKEKIEIQRKENVDRRDLL